METVQLIGLAGMLLVFASFIVKRWVWLYTFNMSGAILLTIYAYLQGDPVFTIVEAGIVAFLAYRLAGEIRRGAARDSGSVATPGRGPVGSGQATPSPPQEDSREAGGRR